MVLLPTRLAQVLTRPASAAFAACLAVSGCQSEPTTPSDDTDPPAATRASSIRRVPNRELGNALHDLLGVDAALTQTLPSDALTFGFDNVPAVLGTSDVYLERWTRLIETVVRDVTLPHSVDRTWRGDDPEAEAFRLIPDGGGWLLEPGANLRVAVWIPVSGIYTLTERVRPPNPDDEPGDRTFGTQINGVPPSRNEPFPTEIVQDGTWILQRRDVVLDRGWNELLVFRPESRGGDTILDSVALRGPLEPSSNELRDRLFVCEPSQADPEAMWEECTDRILLPVARQAWRRDLTPEEMARLRAQVLAVREAEGTFEAAVRSVLPRVLASPRFLFRVEAGDGADQLSPAEVAARLASLLWGSVPDEALLDAAANGELSEERLPAILEGMLADPRSDRFIDGFAGQWLGFGRVADVDLDPDVFPELTPALRDAMQADAASMVRRLLTGDAPLTDLLVDPVRPGDPLLAAHYGLAIGATDPERVGYLGEAAFSVLTAKPTRTSVTRRGSWILTNLLCAPLGMPPANIPPLPEAQTPQEAADMHTANPGCASCHQQTDPLGLALEHFDPLGRWREAYSDGSLVDASARMPDGTPLYGSAELARALADDHRMVDCAVDKLVTYTFGRAPDASEAPWLTDVRERMRANGSTLRGLLEAVVTSPEFRSLEVTP